MSNDLGLSGVGLDIFWSYTFSCKLMLCCILKRKILRKVGLPRVERKWNFNSHCPIAIKLFVPSTIKGLQHFNEIIRFSYHELAFFKVVSTTGVDLNCCFRNFFPQLMKPLKNYRDMVS